jgi:hypothetical protein
MALQDIHMLLMTFRTDPRILKSFGTNAARLQVQLERAKRAQALSVVRPPPPPIGPLIAEIVSHLP